MIRPYKKPRPHREMCWLLDHQTVLHESGLELGFDEIDSQMQVWASTDLVLDLLWKGHGEALHWEGKPIRWSPARGADTWPVSIMRLVCPQNPQEAVDGLQDWRDWLESYGAAPAGSVGGSGFSLLKATLAKPLYTSVGDLPPIKYTVGGRQEDGPNGRPHVFDGTLQHWDMQAAYARTLGNLRYGGRWRAIDTQHVGTVALSADNMLYVRAKVRIPEQPFAPWLGPLVNRPRGELSAFTSLLHDWYPTGRDMQGVWTWRELQQAEASGCRIMRVLAAWFHFASPDDYPFRPWLRAVETGREMNGFAKILAKATGNSTWGQFAVRRHGRKSVVRYEQHRKRPRKIIERLATTATNPSQRAYELAEYICGLVRAELYRGMTHTGESLISGHTDGLWLHGPDRINGWRMKDTAVRLRYLSPQTLAYRRADEDVDVYVFAGVPVQTAAHHFEDEWERTCS